MPLGSQRKWLFGGRGGFPKAFWKRNSHLDRAGGSDAIKLESQGEGLELSLCVLATSAFSEPPRFPAQEQSCAKPFFFFLSDFANPPHSKGRGSHSLQGTWAPGFAAPGSNGPVHPQMLKPQAQVLFLYGLHPGWIKQPSRSWLSPRVPSWSSLSTAKLALPGSHGASLGSQLKSVMVNTVHELDKL